MSVLWELDSHNTHYSVRNSGGSIRLYTNRVFHSQWNPKVPFAGGIWDCLSLPVLYLPKGRIKRILLLGVGGGAVIRQLQELDDYESITAIEIDSVHLDIARQWFEVAGAGVELIHADAIDWLHRYSGPAFDLIIDDLFGHDAGEPMRACELERHWLELIQTHLTSAGLLVCNCVDSAELLSALPEIGAAGFLSGYRLHLPNYENIIGVFSREPLNARHWTNHLESSGLSMRSQRQARTIVRRPLRGLRLYKD